MKHADLDTAFAEKFAPVTDMPIDAGVRPYVLALRSGGVETFESCEGGAGHALPEPTIRFHGGHAEGFHALAVAMDRGLPVAALRLAYPIRDGLPTGPWWEMTFSRRYGEILGGFGVTAAGLNADRNPTQGGESAAKPPSNAGCDAGVTAGETAPSAQAGAAIDAILANGAHPYWDRDHPEHRHARERMQYLFAVHNGQPSAPSAAAAALREIAQIIEAVDGRCSAADGPATPTLREMTQAEMSRIYALARGDVKAAQLRPNGILECDGLVRFRPIGPVDPSAERVR